MERLIKTPEWFQSPETRYPDLESVVRRVFGTVEEAEAYVRSLGVNVDYEQRLDIAQLANEFLSRLKDQKAQMPISLMVHSNYFIMKYPNETKKITAMGDQGIILINPLATFWKDPVYATRTLFQYREWSTPSPLHVFFHEYAHLFQKETTRNKNLTSRQVTLATAVSLRARHNSDEFLSEVYAGLVEGVQYDDDILRTYRRLGGTRP